MDLSSHGGLLLLQREEEHHALASQLASCIKDTRNPYLVRHNLEEIIMPRIFQICLGNEDVNDCDRMRRAQMMQLAVDTGVLDKELCSSDTMCRFENMVDDDDLLHIQEMFLTMFILSYGGKAPGHIILDCDDTNVDTYGNQQLTLFNAYYDSYFCTKRAADFKDSRDYVSMVKSSLKSLGVGRMRYAPTACPAFESRFFLLFLVF